MNYADDRRDRRARLGNEADSGSSLLWKDYQQALTSPSIDHTLLGTTLRDAGWNRHAWFHYGQAWRAQPESWERAADWGQMAELCGQPAIGFVGVWAFRLRLEHATATKRDDVIKTTLKEAIPTDPSWILRDEKDVVGHCGCGHTRCGSNSNFLPFDGNSISRVINSLEECLAFLEKASPSKIPRAHDILQQHFDKVTSNKNESTQPLRLCIDMPPAFLFWQQQDAVCSGGLRDFALPLQLLLVKLLYETLPGLAIVAVAHMPHHVRAPQQRLMAQRYKSHWAYHVFIQSLVLGSQRVKPGRRSALPYYHVPVWDLYWGFDQRKDSSITVVDDSESFASLSRQLIIRQFQMHVTDSEQDSAAPLWLWNPAYRTIPPLYFVGDSHVLSLAWQVLHPTPDFSRRVVPLLVTGLKAWHVRPETRFFTQTCLRRVLRQAQPKTIVVSAGEIDCREGFGGPLLKGYDCVSPEMELDLVRETIRSYIRALEHLHVPQILLLPVPPHSQRGRGREKSRHVRRTTTRLWNRELRRSLRQEHKRAIYCLDYERFLLDDSRVDEYVLKPSLNADSTHMNSAFARHLEAALAESGCDFALL